MIDLILVVFVGAVFYGGFKAGNSYKTVGDMLRAGLDQLK